MILCILLHLFPSTIELVNWDNIGRAIDSFSPLLPVHHKGISSHLAVDKIMLFCQEIVG